MVVLGLILLLVAIVAGVIIIVENSGSDRMVDIHAFGGTWHTDAFWLAVIGAAVLVVAVLGLMLMASGSRRGIRRRSERRQLKRENEALANQVAHTPPPAERGVDDTRVDTAARRDDAPRYEAPPRYDAAEAGRPAQGAHGNGAYGEGSFGDRAHGDTAYRQGEPPAASR